MKFFSAILNAIKAIYHADTSNKSSVCEDDVFYTINHTVVVR